MVEVSVPRRALDAKIDLSASQARDAGIKEAISAELTKEAVPTAELVAEPPHEDLLELGPRWHQIENAFAWVSFGVAALITGFVFFFLATLFSIRIRSVDFPFYVFPALILAVAGFALFIGQLLCLRIPPGTRARPAMIACLAARILAYGLNVYAATAWLDAEATDWRTNWSMRESTALTALALALGGWAVALLAEFSFIAFLKRVGLFLEDGAVVRHARRANGILAGYLVVILGLGAVTIALAMIITRPSSWSWNSLAEVWHMEKTTRAFTAWVQVGISAVIAVFWIVLGYQYRAALSSATTTIKAGLARRAAS
jgi:hypothetical protein